MIVPFKATTTKGLLAFMEQHPGQTQIDQRTFFVANNLSPEWKTASIVVGDHLVAPATLFIYQLRYLQGKWRTLVECHLPNPAKMTFRQQKMFNTFAPEGVGISCPQVIIGELPPSYMVSYQTSFGAVARTVKGPGTLFTLLNGKAVSPYAASCFLLNSTAEEYYRGVADFGDAFKNLGDGEWVVGRYVDWEVHALGLIPWSTRYVAIYSDSMGTPHFHEFESAKDFQEFFDSYEEVCGE